VISSGYAAERLSLAYDCVWPTAVLREVVKVVEGHSERGDTVVSGGVIWEFEAGRHSFDLVSHPLAFRDDVRTRLPEGVETRFSASPPKLIILDGYTEQTWLAVFPWMREQVDENYDRVTVIEGGRYPVEVHVLRGGARPFVAEAQEPKN
jgi:hypothetical protein